MPLSALECVRAIVSDGIMSKAALARSAGLTPADINGCDEPDLDPAQSVVARLERFLSDEGDVPVLATPQEIIDEARNGRMFILVDDEDRENEGDLVIPAQMVTPEAVNFMATHGRGLICLALTRQRVEALRLSSMSQTNRTRHETAFTASIEAREGVTTGISAADRFRTIAVAIDASKGPDDIVTPGHIFPLIARDGGVLVRAGHTEACVDIARLAGLNPSGVICEIMNDDGTMARMDDLVRFARRHGLRIGTIRDLIAYRREHDHLIERRSERQFESEWGGEWKAVCFYNKALGEESLALVKGSIDPAEPVLVRMHMLSLFTDVFAEVTARDALLEGAMRIIGEEGAGVVVLINRPDREFASRMIALAETRADIGAEKDSEQRDYGAGAQILTELGVRDMILLSNTRHSLVALEGYGLSVVGERPIQVETAS
jgi:3,4-dihydroxy 2-butanone 4-phosphate synthase/GTP cyclohydrolase II